MIAFVVVLAVWIACEANLTTIDRPTAGTLALPTGLVVLASQVVSIATRGDGAAIGALLMIGGVALRLWAIVTLGDAFTSTLTSPRLVVAGPYRFARHPSELGLCAIVLGGPLLLGSGWGIVVGTALIPLVVIRCRREDRALASLAGHAAWCREVGWFAPTGHEW